MMQRMNTILVLKSYQILTEFIQASLNALIVTGYYGGGL